MLLGLGASFLTMIIYYTISLFILQQVGVSDIIYHMKADIHPQYYPEAQVVCACGNRFTIGSTRESIHVQLCSNCHPFYTGKQKFVDTASRIEKFQQKQAKAQPLKVKKAEQKGDDRPLTLREMLMKAK